MAKESYYFSHDANARNDERILMLRADHGFEGYGLYWALIEMMFESAETALFHDKVKGVAVSYNTQPEKLREVIATCIAEGLFKTDKEKFWSESLRRRKSKYFELKEKRAAAGKAGMEARWKNKNQDSEGITEPEETENADNTSITKLSNNYNTPITNSENGITKNNKGNEIKVNEIKTVQEIKDTPDEPTPPPPPAEPKKRTRKKAEPDPSKTVYAEFVSMREDEYGKLIEKHGEAFVVRCIQKLNNHKAAKGVTYKSDYHAILNWVENAVNEDIAKEQKYSKPSGQQPAKPNKFHNFNGRLSNVTDEQINEMLANRKGKKEDPEGGTEK